LTQARKDIFIIGGPNGAGKTTAARKFLPPILLETAFLNADEIAREIAPHHPESAALAAGRILLDRLRGFVREGSSFALETTCAGKSYISLLRQCSEEGWRIFLYYLWLPTPEESIARVGQRVREGGHFVPFEDVRRRFVLGL
jgi:predicted ABC-type ATPase